MPEWPSYGNFQKVTQNPNFQKKCKGETKRSFSKIAQKVALASMGQQQSFANVIILKIVSTSNAKTEEDFGAKSSFKTARMAKLSQFSKGHPKPTFSEKVQRGNQGKFLKNHPKSVPHLKGPRARWPKRHYPLISMQLKPKDWRRFCRKKRHQKCPNGQVMAIFAKSPKTRIF